LFERCLAIVLSSVGKRIGCRHFLAVIPTIAVSSPRFFEDLVVDRVLPRNLDMWAQIATTLGPYGVPALAMLGGFVVIYMLLEKTANTVFKLEPKPKSRRL
jgi:hypothetical protein